MNWHQYVLATIFCAAGIFHFIKPKAFMRIMPLYIPYHKLLIYISGVAEICAGIGLLIAATKNLAIYGIIAMLLLFFPVHIHMLVDKKASLNLPKFVLWLRLLMQFGLIYWAYSYL